MNLSLFNSQGQLTDPQLASLGVVENGQVDAEAVSVLSRAMVLHLESFEAEKQWGHSGNFGQKRSGSYMGHGTPGKHTCLNSRQLVPASPLVPAVVPPSPALSAALVLHDEALPLPLPVPP